MPDVYLGHEFEALKCRFEGQTELLYRMTLLDLRIFTGYLTLQVLLGGWLATNAEALTSSWGKFGLMVVDFALAAVATVFVLNDYRRRREVVETVRNCSEALGYDKAGVYLKDRPLNSSTEFRAWVWLYCAGVWFAFAGVTVIMWPPGLSLAASTNVQPQEFRVAGGYEMQTIVTAVVSSVATSVVFFAAGGWLLRTLIEKKLDAFYKERELTLSEVIKRRAEIAADVHLYVKRACGGGATLGKLADPHFEIQVACWFPDDVYIMFRDFVVKLLDNQSGEGMSWTADAEPLIERLIQAIRPDPRILSRPPARLGNHVFHFLPNVGMAGTQEGSAADA